MAVLQIGTTALHLAARAGHLGVCSVLLALGAQVDLSNAVSRQYCFLILFREEISLPARKLVAANPVSTRDLRPLDFPRWAILPF